MEIDIIGVKLWQGSNNPGTENAIDVFLDNGIQNLLSKNGHKVNLLGIVKEPKTVQSEKYDILKYISSVKQACAELECYVDKSLKARHFPLVIGGDHALSIGSISGINRNINSQDLSVIWVDAHTDINTEETSESHNIHGMPVAALMGMGDKRLITNFGMEECKIRPENMYYIGARSIDPPELEIVKDLKLNMKTMTIIKEFGIENVVKSILKDIKTKYIHLSFDVDFIGSEYYTATGLPIPDGPSIEDTIKCLTMLIDSGKVCSMDFVEYSPKYDDNRKKGMLSCFRIFEEIGSHIKN